MRLSKRDVIATVLVGVAVVLHALRSAGTTPSVLEGVRATGVPVLVLGFLASAVAVVPSFDALLHGSKLYVSTASAIGVVAAVAGALVLIDASATALTTLVVAMVVLWAMATTHHLMLSDRRASARRSSGEVTFRL
jgi:hypothetical protein